MTRRDWSRCSPTLISRVIIHLMTDQNRDPVLVAAAVSAEEPADLFDLLLRISHEALPLGRFSTSYHALAAAMHWAKTDQDVQRLLVVAELATEALNRIDREAPDYEHSSPSTSQRSGNVSIFRHLEQQARMAATMDQHNRKHGSLNSRADTSTASLPDDSS